MLIIALLKFTFKSSGVLFDGLVAHEAETWSLFFPFSTVIKFFRT